MKTIKVLFFATAACFLATACTTSAPEDNCKEASYDNIMCYEYSRDDCGNIICAPPSSTDSKKFSSSSTVKSSSSTKKISSSSTAKSSSSVKISSSSFTEKSSSSKATSSSSAGKISSSSNKSSSSSQAKSSSSTKAISSSSVASSSSVEVKSIYEAVQESGKYTTRDSVAAYLCKFDKLPSNYVSKNEGQNLYESQTGKTFEKWNFNPWTTIGVMIGGDKFNNYASNASNYHATLPEGSYHEADVEYSARNRGSKRLVYQSDCIIYYTADHYETFNRLEIR